MSFFNPEIPLKEKIVTRHPWEKYIKDAYAATYKYGHNSAKNPVYPPPKKEKEPSSHRVKFTIIGNRTTKEFIHAINLVKGLHKYRWKYFDAPVIQALTSVEWPKIWNDLKIKYGGPAYCLLTQVAVLMNDQFLGGDKELQELVESKYVYYLQPDYYGEAVKQFSSFVKSSGRPCAYFQISVDDVDIGTMIFMLFSDIVPRTCENFLRLCKETKGGYSGTPIHRIVKDSWIQCGGFGLKDSGLDCENFIVPHDRRGVLGMANDGRHVDCSTQFFVLLQPQPWMAHKYVAFGQLIDGEETLKKIENVPEWYESPKQKIIIYKAGILNMECQDIMINRGANKYIEGHVENLVALGELFYEALLEKVFVEADFRSLQRLQAEIGGEDATPEEAAKNLRATQRFMRKKEEIEKQIEKSQAERSGRATPAADKGENNDFDVEEYEYEPEEYSYKHVSVPASGSVPIKPEKPFYIPLTDVPYPGEVDSTFDLKKLLQGDYCLEIDLDKEAGKKKKGEEQRMSYPSELFDALFEGASSSENGSQHTLDSEDEREIRKYLKINADRVSFAGEIVKAVAKSGKYNLFENQKGSDMITDEALRKYRIAEEEYKSHRDKKVSISLPSASDTHREIKRRQTGFVRPEDLARIRQFQREAADSDDDDDEDDEDDDYQPYTRQVAISQQPELAKDKSTQKKEVKRRQTGFVRPADLEKLHIFSKTSSELLMDDEDEDDKERDRRRVSGLSEESEDELERPSVLARLYDEVDTDDLGPGPTLKDTRRISEFQNRNMFLTFSPTKHLKSTDTSREMYKRRSIAVHNMPEKSIDQVLLLQHGQKVYRKISSDYVRTIDQIEQKEEKSIRSLEYARKRPAISVKDYQKKNKEYQENASKLSIEEKKMSTIKTQDETAPLYLDGLRLPGDTPLYLSYVEIPNF